MACACSIFLATSRQCRGLRLQSVSRRLVGERLIDVFVAARRLIALTEARCAVDPSDCGGLSSACACGACARTRRRKRLCCSAACLAVRAAAGGVIVAIAANLQSFSQLRERGAHLQRRRNVEVDAELAASVRVLAPYRR